MSAYNISSVINPDLKSFIKSCLIIEKWHFFSFPTCESTFLRFSVTHLRHQCLHKTCGRVSAGPRLPHLDGLRCSPWGSMRMVSVEILPRPQTPFTVSGQPAMLTFRSSSRCLSVTSSPESLGFAALVQHMWLWARTPGIIHDETR